MTPVSSVLPHRGVGNINTGQFDNNNVGDKNQTSAVFRSGDPSSIDHVTRSYSNWKAPESSIPHEIKCIPASSITLDYRPNSTHSSRSTSSNSANDLRFGETRTIVKENSSSNIYPATNTEFRRSASHDLIRRHNSDDAITSKNNLANHLIGNHNRVDDIITNKPTVDISEFNPPTPAINSIKIANKIIATTPAADSHKAAVDVNKHNPADDISVLDNRLQDSSLLARVSDAPLRKHYSGIRNYSSIGNKSETKQHSAISEGLAIIGQNFDKQNLTQKQKNQQLSADNPLQMMKDCSFIGYTRERNNSVRSNPAAPSSRPHPVVATHTTELSRKSKYQNESISNILHTFNPRINIHSAENNSDTSKVYPQEQDLSLTNEDNTLKFSNNKDHFTNVEKPITTSKFADSSDGITVHSKSTSYVHAFAGDELSSTQVTKESNNNKSKVLGSTFTISELHDAPVARDSTQLSRDELSRRRSLESVSEYSDNNNINLDTSDVASSNTNPIGSYGRKHTDLTLDHERSSKDNLLNKLLSRSSSELMPVNFSRPSDFTRSLRGNAQPSLRMSRSGPVKASEAILSSREDTMSVEMAHGLVSQELRQNKVSDVLSKIKEKRPSCDVSYVSVKKNIERQHVKMFNKAPSQRSGSVVTENRRTLTASSTRSGHSTIRKSQSYDRGLNLNNSIHSTRSETPNFANSKKRIVSKESPVRKPLSSMTKTKIQAKNKSSQISISQSCDNLVTEPKSLIKCNTVENIPPINLSGLNHPSVDESIGIHRHDSLSSINLVNSVDDHEIPRSAPIDTVDNSSISDGVQRNTLEINLMQSSHETVARDQKILQKRNKQDTRHSGPSGCIIGDHLDRIVEVSSGSASHVSSSREAATSGPSHVTGGPSHVAGGLSHITGGSSHITGGSSRTGSGSKAASNVISAAREHCSLSQGNVPDIARPLSEDIEDSMYATSTPRLDGSQLEFDPTRTSYEVNVIITLVQSIFKGQNAVDI